MSKLIPIIRNFDSKRKHAPKVPKPHPRAAGFSVERFRKCDKTPGFNQKTGFVEEKQVSRQVRISVPNFGEMEITDK